MWNFWKTHCGKTSESDKYIEAFWILRFLDVMVHNIERFKMLLFSLYVTPVLKKTYDSRDCVYHAGKAAIPVAYALIKKEIRYSEIKTKKEKRKSEFTKNHHFRELLHVSCQNKLSFQYVLADSWFCSKDNMNFIRRDCDKHFIMAAKSNRLVSLSEEDKKQGCSQRIDTVNFPEDSPVRGWIAGISFPVLLFRQVFKNKDGSSGILYLVCSDLNCDGKTIRTIYKKRWKVEEYHRSLKQNASASKSPTRTRTTQTNHFVAALWSFAKLELLKVRTKKNHYALKTHLYLSALQHAFGALRQLEPVRLVPATA